MPLPSLSFRARILLVVFGVGVVPVGLVGVWLTTGTARTGGELLRQRLGEAVRDDARAMELRWVPYRSALLDFSETPPVRTALASNEPLSPELREGLAAGFAGLDVPVEGLVIRDYTGRVLARLGEERRSGRAAASALGSLLPVPIPLYEPVSGDPLGELEALVPVGALHRPSGGAAMVGAAVTAVEPGTGALLLPAPFPPSVLEQDRFQWNDETWLVERASVMEPRLELVAAAPVAPFAEPFRATARRGTWFLLAVAGGGLLLAGYVTSRMTASLERVSDAASAVAEGDLERTVPEEGDDEVARLALAFNRMTESLRETLAQLSERESLAAVNEFAAALAHEIRNPLTGIQLDLQEVEEELPTDSRLRELQANALEDLRRLDRVVQGALETARSGRVEPRPTDVGAPIADALRAARPHAEERSVELVEPESVRPPMRAMCDPDALERALLNLLLNGVQASDAGGRIRVTVAREGDVVAITVTDHGSGIEPDELERITEPFFTTRPGGTGVGLAVTRRIVTAHGGALEIESRPGEGTTVRIRLPAAPAERSVPPSGHQAE